jgi:hypothetical protein
VGATGPAPAFGRWSRYRVSTPIPDTSGKTSDGPSEMLTLKKRKAEDFNIVKSLDSNISGI